MNIDTLYRALNLQPSQPPTLVRHELPFFSRIERFSLPLLYGEYWLNPIREPDRGVWDLLIQESLSEWVGIDEILFLDLETTGLSGGTGTIPFLVGLAWITDSHLVVEQMVLNELSAIGRMLEELRRRVASYRWLVTYNGKSFDAAVIRSQFRLNRLGGSPLDRLSHFDLLHICRRIWKNQYDGYQLSRMESELLGYVRHDDLPGSLIPEQYFRYLRRHDPSIIQPILEHNRSDMISLVGVFSRIDRLTTDPKLQSKQVCNIIDFSSRFGKYIQGHQWAESMAARQWPESEQAAILFRNGLLLRKMGRHHEACQAWIRSGNGESLLELAKLYEHTLKDPNQALTCARQSRSILREQDYNSRFLNQTKEWKRIGQILADLDKRIIRLEKRLTL